MKRIRVQPTVQITSCSYHGSVGGAYTTAIAFEAALRSAGLDAEFVKWQALRPTDYVWLNSVGMNGETNQAANQRRLDKLKGVLEKTKSILVANDFTEPRTFAHSYEALKDWPFDLVLSIEPQAAFVQFLKEAYPNSKRIESVRHPWIIDSAHFRDKSQWSDHVVNLSRFASTKRSVVILELAKYLLGKKRFTLASREKGIYWFRAVKGHPAYGCATFRGEEGFGHYAEELREAAFMIDLTYFWTKQGVSGERTQMTTLEAINCGCIPINFDCWRWTDGYEALWLPSPQRIKGRFQYPVASYAETILNTPYDFCVAKRNYDWLRRVSDHAVIGKQLKQLLSEL